MPNQIWIVRHAKSSWADINMHDHDRPLNDRGTKDAPLMGARIKALVPKDIFLYSSTALRAKSTCEFFRQEFEDKNCRFELSRDLYHASEFQLLISLQNLDEAINDVMIFGHNNGISFFINRLATPLLQEVPTCGVIKISTTALSWADIRFENMHVEEFFYPKQGIE